MGILWQRTRGCLLIAAISWLTVFAAHANQVAPRPIEQGEWYLGVFGGVERMTAPEFKALELFKDDRGGGGGPITIVDQEGYLLERRVKATELIPGFHFGYGFGKGPEDAVYRVEFSAEAFDRKESYFDASTTPAADGFFVDGDEVGLFARYAPIDGKDNEDDTDAAYLYNGAVIDEILNFKEQSRNTNVSLYFDSRNGPWVFSRGVSVTYAYLFQKIDHEYQDPTLLGTPGIGQESDYTFRFRYRSRNHTVGSRLHYSVGYEIVKGWSIFTHARVSLAAKHINLKGRQDAPCLTTCDPVAGNDIFTPGTRKIDINDWKFAYDARMGLGTSARLGPIRLTVHGGGTRVGGWTTPREFEKGVGIGTSAGWGYFGTASLDVVF